jgi:hypothetical protein
MSIFSSIVARIFPSTHSAVTAAQASAPAPDVASGTAETPATQPPASVPPVDIEAVISAMPNASQLNWKTSIVDLLKVLGLDSSLDARKALAQELGYTGSTTDSAAMNMWLHKEVVAKLVANGGKVPDSMKT